MLLAINIGNSNILLGIFDGVKLVASWRLPTDPAHTVGEYEDVLKKQFFEKKYAFKDTTDVIIGSVVPGLTPTFLELIGKIFSGNPVVVGTGIRLPMKLLVDNPAEVGADIIANVAAAHSIYKGPAIVIDLGTATTFSVVTKRGDFSGMVIAPGLLSMAKGLTQSGALLPEVDVTAPKTIIGTNTVDCMSSGLYYGYIGLVEGLLQRIKSESAWKDAKAIATGGLSSTFANEIHGIDFTNANLTLEGMRIIFQLNQPA